MLQKNHDEKLQTISEYLQNISRSKSFGKFVLIVHVKSSTLKISLDCPQNIPQILTVAHWTVGTPTLPKK